MKCIHCGEEIYYRSHVCLEEIIVMENAASALWNSVTDMMPQSDIDTIVRLHKSDLDTLGLQTTLDTRSQIA